VTHGDNTTSQVELVVRVITRVRWSGRRGQTVVDQVRPVLDLLPLALQRLKGLGLSLRGSGLRLSPVWLRNPLMRSGRCWIRCSRLRMILYPGSREEVVPMLETYFVKPQTVDRIRACWVGAEIERYADWLSEQGL